VANHKSAEKRARQTPKRTQRNRDVKSAARTYIRMVREAIESVDAQEAEQALAVCIKQIDRAVAKGVLHRKTGSRTISRLSTQVASLKSSAA
jgi:small subunit ribosomal protein S20